MSVSTKFYTLKAMVDAVVIDVSSDDAQHPAEHALTLEPNFSWEADELDAQHYLTTDLTKPFDVDSLVWIHRDPEAVSPSPLGVYADVYYSNDNATYTKVTLSVDPGIDGNLLKISEFVMASNQRYWKVVFRSTDDPSYYPAEDMRVSAVWWAKKHTITAGPAWPMNDTTVYPKKEFDMAYGDKAAVGFSKNEQVQFTRTYACNDTDYTALLEVLAESNCGENILAMQERDENPMLVKIGGAVSTQNFAIGWQTITLGFTKIPIVGRDEFY